MNQNNFLQVGITIECGRCHPEKFEDCDDVRRNNPRMDIPPCNCICHQETRTCKNGHKMTGIGFDDMCPECESPWEESDIKPEVEGQIGKKKLNLTYACLGIPGCNHPVGQPCNCDCHEEIGYSKDLGTKEFEANGIKVVNGMPECKIFTEACYHHSNCMKTLDESEHRVSTPFFPSFEKDGGRLPPPLDWSKEWTEYVRTYVTRYCPEIKDWQLLAIAGNLEQVIKSNLIKLSEEFETVDIRDILKKINE